MSETIVTPRRVEQQTPAAFSHGMVNRLLDAVETSLVVAERSGRVLLMNGRARKHMQLDMVSKSTETNLFSDVLGVGAREIFHEIEGGKHEMKMEVERGGSKQVASIKRMQEQDRVVVQLEPQREI